MAEVTEFHLGEGQPGQEEETQEQLQSAHKKLKDLIANNGRDGALITFGKQELSMMQKMLSTGDDAWVKQQFWRMCDFTDEDEALDHIAAFYEAKDLGMDTSFNISFTFALCSANRKINRTNLIAQLLDAMQHGKWASAPQGKGDHRNGANPRSPLSN